MLRRVEKVPNEPQQFIAVVGHWTATRPMTGEKIRVSTRYFAVSARFVSSNDGSAEEKRTPVTWKFICGFATQDDQGDPRRDEWTGRDVDVPAKVRDARPRLEKAMGWKDCEWYTWDWGTPDARPPG